MKKRLLAVLLLITGIFAHAVDRYSPQGGSLADVLQWLAAYAACVGQYNTAYLGNYKSGDPDPENLYWPTDIREYMAEQSRDETKVDTFYGICFNYAQAAYNVITQNYRSDYASLGIKAWYMAACWKTNPSEIKLFDPVSSREQSTTRFNGVYMRESSRHNVQNHGDIPMNHAWLWVYANDGTIYWIDPTWTDNSGYIVWGFVRNGREEPEAPAERLCRTIPSGVSFASFSNGNAARNQGNYDQAIINYNEAVRLEPKDAATYNSRGLTYYKKGDYDRAIANYNQALALDPSFADAYYTRGAAYLAKGNYDRAIADCGEALKLDPNFDAAYASRGIAYFAKGDIDRAFADYNQAINLNSNNIRALHGRAQMYLAKGNYKPAIADVVLACKLLPREATYVITHGEILLAMKNKQAARNRFELALRLSPNNARAKELLQRAR
jgi:Flp pilus assembly protein TadD